MDNFKEFLIKIDNQEHRKYLENIVQWIIDSFPTLDKKIAWNQPIFTDHGTFIIGFSVSKKHIAIAPEKQAIDMFSKEIIEAGYSHGSNVFRITWQDNVDYELLKKIIEYNMEDKKNCNSFWRK